MIQIRKASTCAALQLLAERSEHIGELLGTWWDGNDATASLGRELDLADVPLRGAAAGLAEVDAENGQAATRALLDLFDKVSRV